MFKIFLSVLLILFMLTGVASADFYKWEDEEGNLHITDYPPPTKSAKKIKIHETDANAGTTLPRSSPKAVAPSPVSSPSEAAKPRTAHEVILYTTSWCPYCKMAKAYFESRGVPYTDYDIEKDSEAAAKKKQMSSGGVPFAIVNGEHISGYSPAAYDPPFAKQSSPLRPQHTDIISTTAVKHPLIFIISFIYLLSATTFLFFSAFLLKEFLKCAIKSVTVISVAKTNSSFNRLKLSAFNVS